MFGTGESQIRR